MTGSLFEVQDLFVKAKDKEILKNISCVLNEGETLSLIGESGGGKSTFLNAIMNLLPSPSLRKTYGRILFNGEEQGEKLKRGKDIAIIFQDASTHLNPVKKIKWQLEEVFKLHNEKVNRERINELFERFKILNPNKKLNSYPFEISGGEAQRILIIMAFLLKPKIILADEPTASLDKESEKNVMNFFLEFQEKENGALIISNHNLKLIETYRQYKHQVMVLKNGVIIEKGDVNKIFKEPSHPYTKELLTFGRG